MFTITFSQSRVQDSQKLSTKNTAYTVSVTQCWFLLCIYCSVGSGDKPTITQFNRYVDEIAPRWYDLGAELLQKCVNFLRIIKANHSHDVRICCQEVFNKWIEEDNEASWDSLIDALIKIELHAVAKRIKKDVTKGLYLISTRTYIHTCMHA